ncbi:MAG: acetyl-coenzyme A synthetase N-terminal domain-containing protein, partial [Gammaproteobacteria bacterium]
MAKYGEMAMTQNKIYPVPVAIAEHAFVNSQQYKQMYESSIIYPDSFWAEQAEKFITWQKKWDKVQEWSFNDNVYIKW